MSKNDSILKTQKVSSVFLLTWNFDSFRAINLTMNKELFTLFKKLEFWKMLLGCEFPMTLQWPKILELYML